MNKKIFFVGVGGIGVSAIAKYFHKEGYEIFGSDENKNKNIEMLEKKFGLKFFPKHQENNIQKDFDFLVYSPAISEKNPERKEAKNLGISEFSYPQILGKISKEKYTISIAGTNGKTTTSTIVLELLDNFSKTPLTILGGIAKKFSSNFIYSKSDSFLVESCEYKNSFMEISPDVIAITNISPDHLDFFGNFKNYQKIFENFLNQYKESQKEKILICNKNEKNLKNILKKAKEKNIKIIDYKKYEIKNFKIPGKHNIENAQVALAICDIFKIDLEKAKIYLEENFVGVKRRFEFVGEKNGMEIYDDYAHNPEGLNVLKCALDEKFPDKKKVLVFEPHLFSRTQDFFQEFAEEISKYDEIFLLPIYKSRENPKDFSVNSQMLFEKIYQKNKNIFFCQNFLECMEKIKEKKYDKNFVFVSAGAGDVFEISHDLVL